MEKKMEKQNYERHQCIIRNTRGRKFVNLFIFIGINVQNEEHSSEKLR
jgi:hypothetical protein